MKKNQIGLNEDKACHVYSNPLMPSVCPLRAITSYLFCWWDQRVFAGKDEKSRFKRLLHECFIKYKDKHHTNEKDMTELGSHSIRKGAETYCCTLLHPRSPIVSVYQRAGWILGQVNEHYLKYENAGDNLVGRTLTGIPPVSGSFTMLL